MPTSWKPAISVCVQRVAVIDVRLVHDLHLQLDGLQSEQCSCRRSKLGDCPRRTLYRRRRRWRLGIDLESWMSSCCLGAGSCTSSALLFLVPGTSCCSTDSPMTVDLQRMYTSQRNVETQRLSARPINEHRTRCRTIEALARVLCAWSPAISQMKQNCRAFSNGIGSTVAFQRC